MTGTTMNAATRRVRIAEASQARPPNHADSRVCAGRNAATRTAAHTKPGRNGFKTSHASQNTAARSAAYKRGEISRVTAADSPSVGLLVKGGGATGRFPRFRGGGAASVCVNRRVD